MNGYAWAAIGVMGAGAAVYAATAIRDRRRDRRRDDDDTAPHDRVRLRMRERARWRRLTRRFGRDLRIQLTAAWIEECVGRIERRLREHYGDDA